jgi:hypothetical protein
MRPEEIGKLLGGYATGTLTAEERQALFAAALEDQELFDALAREQSLRDLLRDPAARAELLGALDTPPSRLGGFWQWLRRPVVAGLVTAGVAAVAVVAVWQGTRIAPVKPAAPMMVAELRPRERMPAPSPARPPAAASQPEDKERTKVSEASAAVTAEKKAVPVMPPPEARQRTKVAEAPAAVTAEKKAVPVMAVATPSPPGPEAAAGLTAGTAAIANVPAMAPPPPPAPAAAMARKAEAGSTAAGQPVGAISGTLQNEVALDARALFYLNQLAPAPGANAFVGGGGGAPPPARAETPQAGAAPRRAKTVVGLVAPMTATAPLGVRVSILRGENEVDLTTVLDPGETVRLKLIPNADGFLYVTEGARTVASAAAQRLQPFETPELRFDGSGQKQLVVTLSRSRQTVAPRSFGTRARGNLVETSADQGRATYVVSGPREAGARQVVVPVTLTYR